MNDPKFALNQIIQRRIRQDVQSMHAYAVQPSEGFIKLDAMENPYRLPDNLQAQLGQRLGAVALNRYPDDRVNHLRQRLAAYADMPAGFELMLGNGSDELIAILAMACDVAQDPVTGAKPVILAPVPGFVMYATSAQLQGLPFEGVPLTPDFELDVPAMVDAIGRLEPAIVYLAYPNNPTATLWSEASMKIVAAAAGRAGSLLVVDEAYQPFSSRTYLDVIRQDPKANAHVLLMRTMSKFGLAGVRIGYLMGAAELIAQIDKVRPPYNISVLNYECALFALDHASVFAAQANDIRSQRDRLQHAFEAMPALQSWASEANMILLRISGKDDPAQRLFDGLKQHGILVKNVSKMHPLLANCLRVTVGAAPENDALLAALKALL